MKIGHKAESETQFISFTYIIDENVTTDICIVDTPGFGDTRGVTIDLSNSICITNVLKACESVIPIVLLSYYDILNDSGEPLRKALDVVVNFIQDLDDAIKKSKILIYITHINEDYK